MQTGDVLRGKYRLLRLLGDGGMGSVYEAHHEGLGTRVAIKVLHSDLARRPGLIERFLREARVSAQVKSPNVVQVIDVDRTDDGVAYIVMELLEGEPLATLLEREHKVPVPVAIDFTAQILRALEAAHALGVVHRDLKPENVFVTTVAGKPWLMLIDFGIAKARQMDSQNKNLTVAGIVMGTPEYMAPEQAHAADRVDARSDLYAVGVMLYEMLSGARPVVGDDARLVAVRVERGEVRPLVHLVPGLPPDLAGLVHRAMAARPELRFGTATEMRVALEAMGDKRVAQPSPSTPEPAPAPGRGTVLSDPTGEGLRAPQQTSVAAAGTPSPGAYGGGPGPTPGPPAYGAYAPPAGYATPGAPGGYPPPAAAGTRGRPRKKGASGTIWLLVGLPVVLGIGIVLAFAMSGSTPGPAPAPQRSTPPPPQVNIAPTQTSAPPPPGPGPNDPIAPLTPAGPIPHGAPGGPGPGVKPHPSATPSASGSASAAPVASAPEPSSPFPGLPGFPSIPNPFPSPSSSGVGPVMTLPTSLPFPFPGAPAQAAPSPSPSHAPAPPSPGGKAI